MGDIGLDRLKMFSIECIHLSSGVKGNVTYVGVSCWVERV